MRQSFTLFSFVLVAITLNGKFVFIDHFQFDRFNQLNVSFHYFLIASVSIISVVTLSTHCYALIKRETGINVYREHYPDANEFSAPA